VLIPNASRSQSVEVPPWPQEVEDDLISGLLELARDTAPDVAAHMERTARLAKALVGDLGLDGALARLIVLTARLHDIGKLGIPPWVIEKAGPLSEFERGLMRQNSAIGQKMLERRPELMPLGPLIRATHERWDGTGYPDGLRGPAIPLPSRIVSVCDAFDAMTRPRVYSRPKSIDAALRELDRCSGTQFDPGVVTAFRELLETRFDQLAKGA
jgi:two-component system, cell cycle response regulator